MAIPYKIAVLVYVFDEAGKLLLLHRKKPPNRDLYSPIGGKLEQGMGESPYACACLREIQEEIRNRIDAGGHSVDGDLSRSRRLCRESGRMRGTHWLMFCFEGDAAPGGDGAGI